MSAKEKVPSAPVFTLVLSKRTVAPSMAAPSASTTLPETACLAASTTSGKSLMYTSVTWFSDFQEPALMASLLERFVIAE